MADPAPGPASRSFDVVRPVVHLAPPLGWLNDPNGLCRHDGVYHAFYQHNLAADVWGPMHWRHATSTDLHTWHDHGIALAPDELGTIFSGSAVVDAAGTAGFGEGAAVAVFTHAGAEQVQSLAWSGDGLATWTKFDGNPVLAPPAGDKDFRDPKVFWWGPPAGGHWVMVLAAGTRVQLYRSDDLRCWEPTGSLSPQLAPGVVLECPDLFEVRVDGSGDRCWFLTFSLGGTGIDGHGATLALPGGFDGDEFEAHDPAAPPVSVDHGADFYAAQTFADGPGGRRLWMAWLSSWHYAMAVPSSGWRGVLSIPRELDAVAADGGLRLRQRPARELAALRTRCVADHDGPLRSPVVLRPADGAFAYDIEVELGPQAGAAATVEIGDGGCSVVSLTLSARAVALARRSPPGWFVADSFEREHVAPLEPAAERAALRIVIDSTSLEVFAAGGVAVMSASYFWDGVPALGLLPAGDEVADCRVQIHELRPHPSG